MPAADVEGQKRVAARQKAMEAAFEPLRAVGQADIDKANERHERPGKLVEAEVMFTELGWAVGRNGGIVRGFGSAAEAHAFLALPRAVGLSGEARA